MIELLILIISILAFGSYKKDFAALVFSGVGFILYGLALYTSDVGFGSIAIGFGVYVAFRAGIDLITYKRKEEVTDDN